MRSTALRAFLRPTQTALRPAEPSRSTREPGPVQRTPTGRELSRELLDQLFGSIGSPRSSPSSSSSTAPRASTAPTTNFESLFVEVQAPNTAHVVQTRTALQLFHDERRHFQPNTMLAPWQLGAQHIIAKKRILPKNRPLPPGKALASQLDPFVIRGINPLDHYLNPHYAFSSIGGLGDISPRKVTMFTQKTQRRMAKLIKRQRAMGLISYWTNAPVKGGYGDQRS